MTEAAGEYLGARTQETGPAADRADQFEHWTLSRRDDVAWLLLDQKDTAVNTLSVAVLAELDRVLDRLEQDSPRGLVLRSAKKAGFVAGADIREFRGWTDEAQLQESLEKGHAVLRRLEKLKCPTIAVIHGYCLGGGFELALACDYRLALEGAHFGFPEVKLGLHPGLGGTGRLVKLISPIEAMTLMMTGKTVYTSRARKLGIADAVLQERHLDNAVRDFVGGKKKPRKQEIKHKLQRLGPVRRYLSGKMRDKVKKKTPKDHYPAPYALIDLWEKYGGSRRRMLKAEIPSFARLMMTDTAQNLIRVFFLHESLKKRGSGAAPIDHVHVIGAGAMGGDIAGWCAMKGLRVTLSDQKTAPVATAIKKAAKLCESKHLTSREQRDALDRLIPDMAQDGLARADLVIEAVPENREIKHKVYAEIEPRMKADAILATNTSSIPLNLLGQGLERPERLVGLHFFNPVSHMEIVEVVTYGKVRDDIYDMAQAFVGRVGKLATPVNSAPGFLVNRALMPYLMEAMKMVDEGQSRETVDRAAVSFGMPVGPVELADQVGLDICLDVAEMLKESLEKPMSEIPGWLRRKVENEELGRKSGKGFYDWKQGKAVRSGAGSPPGADVTDRLILPLLDACVECLRREVVTDEDILDGAMIFATGFAPFRGGPLHYARQRGIAEIVDRLTYLADEYGERFRPDPGWRNLK